MNLHTRADELENFFLIEQFLHLPQFVQIDEIRVKRLSFVKWRSPWPSQNALHELHELTLIPQSTIRFHSKESPPKLTNRPRRSFEAAR